MPGHRVGEHAGGHQVVGSLPAKAGSARSTIATLATQSLGPSRPQISRPNHPAPTLGGGGLGLGLAGGLGLALPRRLITFASGVSVVMPVHHAAAGGSVRPSVLAMAGMSARLNSQRRASRRAGMRSAMASDQMRW